MSDRFFEGKRFVFDRWAASYDWLFPSVIYQAIQKRLLDSIPSQDGLNVLDLGCGTGRLLDRLASTYPNLQGTGLDLSPEMIRQARQRDRHPTHLTFLEGNAEQLPFADAQFDSVFNTISFLHYPQPETVLSEVRRVLHPNGKFYLVDITLRPESEGTLPISPGGIRLYSPPTRKKLGQQAQLECLGHVYLLGPVLLSIFKPI